MGIVRLNEVITKMNLENLTPEIDVSKIKIRQPDINRPAVQMTGYFEHFAAGRIQIIGLVEHSYMAQMETAQKQEIYRKFLSLDIPCVVFCRELEPDELFRKYAVENGVAELNRTEEFFEFAIVDADATLTGANTNARDGGLTAAGAEFVVFAVAFNNVVAAFNHLIILISLNEKCSLDHLMPSSIASGFWL